MATSHRFSAVKVSDLFEVKSGDFHAIKELDEGATPLISCSESNNGVTGYFDIPDECTYQHALTVTYDGRPLTVKFHPYKFGAYDNVAILIPRQELKETTLLFVAAVLNRMAWKYSYGRKCYKEKLKKLLLPVPLVKNAGELLIDENAIDDIFAAQFNDFVPKKFSNGIASLPKLKWQAFNITDILSLQRGDFHSISALAEGQHMTVSRAADDNGVVGYFERPDKAKIYKRGHITVSTVGGDAFVQLDDFIATDNVIVCAPKDALRFTTLFFIAFAINYQKWRYGYGRQCYESKLERVNIYLPVTSKNCIDEDAMEAIVKQTSYWPHVEKRFADIELSSHFLQTTANKEASQSSLPL